MDPENKNTDSLLKTDEEDVTIPEIRQALAKSIQSKINDFTKSLVELRERELAKAEGKMPKAGKVAHKAPGSGGQVLEKAGMGAAVPTAKPPSGKVPGMGAAPTAAVGSPGVGVAPKAPAGAPKPPAAGGIAKPPAVPGMGKAEIPVQAGIAPTPAAPAKPAPIGIFARLRAPVPAGIPHTHTSYGELSRRLTANPAPAAPGVVKSEDMEMCEHGSELAKCGCGKKKVHKAELASNSGKETAPGKMLTRGPEGDGPPTGKALTRGPEGGGPATGKALTRGPEGGGPATGKDLTRGPEGGGPATGELLTRGPGKGGPATGEMFKGEKCAMCGKDEHKGKCAC